MSCSKTFTNIAYLLPWPAICPNSFASKLTIKASLLTTLGLSSSWGFDSTILYKTSWTLSLNCLNITFQCCWRTLVVSLTLAAFATYAFANSVTLAPTIASCWAFTSGHGQKIKSFCFCQFCNLCSPCSWH